MQGNRVGVVLGFLREGVATMRDFFIRALEMIVNVLMVVMIIVLVLTAFRSAAQVAGAAKATDRIRPPTGYCAPSSRPPNCRG